jgi:predicted ABC-type ATPase
MVSYDNLSETTRDMLMNSHSTNRDPSIILEELEEQLISEAKRAGYDCVIEYIVANNVNH